MCAVMVAAMVALLDARSGSVNWTFVGQEFVRSAPLIAGAVGGLICVIGVPAWLPLHFTGRRHWVFATSLGAILFFVGWFGPHTGWLSYPINGDEYDDYGWSDAASDSAIAALAGALVAFVMWRVAYRKTDAVTPTVQSRLN